MINIFCCSEFEEKEKDLLFEEKLKTLAVIEIVLKQRVRAKDEKELLAFETANIGISENCQSLIETFSRFVRAALYFISSKFNRSS